MSTVDNEERRWLEFEQVIRQVRESFSNIPAEELQNLIDEAVNAARQRANGARND